MSEKEFTQLKSEDDRIKSYVNKQFMESPKDTAKYTRNYLVAGIVLNLLSCFYFAMGHIHIVKENASNPLNLIRLDGIIVNEGSDVRRDVMLRNALQKTSDKKVGGNE